MSENLSNSSWNPPLSGGNSVYPFNNVTKTRSGHIFEVDDTLGYERIHRQHKSGTHETFTESGGRILTVTGENYTVVFKDDNMVVVGNVNITIAGDGNTTVMGNYNLHVEGDMNTTVRGIHRTKLGKNRLAEISGEDATHVGGMSTYVCGPKTEKVNGPFEKTVNGSSFYTINGALTNMVLSNITEYCNGVGVYTSALGMTLGSAISVDIGAVAVNISAAATNIISGAVTVTGLMNVGGVVTALDTVAFTLAGPVSLGTHVHVETSSVTLPPML